VNAPRDPWALLRAARAAAVHHELPPTEAHVLLILATYANSAGEAFPGLDTLARDARRVRSVVAAAVAELGRRGLVERKRRGPSQPALTRLLLPGLTSNGPDVNTSGEPDVNDSRRPVGRTADVRWAGRRTSPENNQRNVPPSPEGGDGETTTAGTNS